VSQKTSARARRVAEPGRPARLQAATDRGGAHRVGSGSSGHRSLDIESDRQRLRRVSTPDLTLLDVAAIRELLLAAFGSEDEERFTDDDWDHAVGGVHFVLELDGDIIAHASVVEREIHAGHRALRTGYVEAVATAPHRQGAGFGSLVVGEVTAYIRDQFELGALGTGRHLFYERLGWLTWAGPSYVRTADGVHRTPDDDGWIMVLATPASPPLDVAATLSCEWRAGDVW
jgi:aminoglycoside 2'-N-acetyltransferase I